MTTLSVSATALTTGSLATYRLTRLITSDVITEPLRTRIWNRYPPESTFLGEMISCDHCAGVYAAAAVTMLAVGTMPYMPRPVRSASNVLLATLALSGAVSLYHEHRERG